MQAKFLSKDKIFIQPTKFADILIKSSGYEDFDSKIIENSLEYDNKKVYEIAQSGFVDFNQHLYEDLNEMNSISTGIYLEKSLITFRIFIWGSKGEGFEIFKHVLRGEEISKLNDITNIKEYIYSHIDELERGIINTYDNDTTEAFKKFGIAIESRKLPLKSILEFLSIDNNIKDFS
ncbi:hypothetical protein CHF27_009750 [Romboutsia maritimum]|uniref:Uncharacterized protein n=1 Tax=Romboutsia maritimum TaxID=2020948 RepID=A0A371IRL3_9FIRM|nr:hypothetical protein [Romboutsia maritimum]RDY23119.1 hypothetical protein CHF27_009750 [Romboutsia maritimum]